MEVALAVVEDHLSHFPVPLTLPDSLQHRALKLAATAHVLVLVVDESQPRHLMQVWSAAARQLVQQHLQAKTPMT